MPRNTQKKKDTVVVTIHSPEDIAGIVNVDEECFGELSVGRRWFSQRLLVSDSVDICYVARRVTDKRILGYLVAEYQGDQVKISRFAVTPMHRKQGIGRKMMLQLIMEKPPEVSMIHCTVPEYSTDTQLFLKALNFLCFGVKKNAFKRQKQDGYYFEWEEENNGD